MANRTIQIRGKGYGNTPAQVTATVNGNVVFSGNVTTVDEPVPQLPNLEIPSSDTVLFTFDVDLNFVGNLAMTCNVSSSTVIFEEVYANYELMFNPVYSQEQLGILLSPTTTPSQRVAIYEQVANPPLNQDEINLLLDPSTPLAEKDAILVAHNCQLNVSSGPDGFVAIDFNNDPRNNVYIDGVLQIQDHEEYSGTWWWIIPPDSELSYELEIDAAYT